MSETSIGTTCRYGSLNHVFMSAGVQITNEIGLQIGHIRKFDFCLNIVMKLHVHSIRD